MTDEEREILNLANRLHCWASDRRDLEDRIRHGVRQAREMGQSWSGIAHVLEMTPTAVRRRYG